MERKRGMAQQPAAKRARMTAVSVGDGEGDAGAGGDEASPPRSPKLRPAFLVVLFAVRMIVMNPVPVPAAPSISEIEDKVKRIVDGAIDKFDEIVSSKVEKAFQALQGQIDTIHHVVRQMARLNSNRLADQHTRPEPNQEDAAGNGSNKNIRLCFLNDLKPPIYTDKKITDENNAAIKLTIFEGDKMITSGPLSKVKVEILVLRAEFWDNGRSKWTGEEFDSHVVQGQGEQGLLGTVRLTNGEEELSQIRFKKGTCRKHVIMAARVCKGEITALRVEEAIMKPVVIQDRRNEANEKRYPPRLDDDVFRLEEIARNGAYRKRLKKENICQVQEFLKALNKDPNRLRKILKMETKNESWSSLTRHAKQCVLEDRPELKRYQSEDGRVALFFNCVHDLVGADFGCCYVASCHFKTDEKALVDKWKRLAYDELEDIVSDYVIKGNVPEQISLATASVAGPYVQAVGTSQPIFFADHHTAPQGIGATEISPHGGINHVTPTIFYNATFDEMSFHPDYLNANDFQDNVTALLNQQPIFMDSNMASCHQNHLALMDSAFTEAIAHVDRLQVPMPGEGGAFFGFTTGAPQTSSEHGQGPSYSAIPGSGPNDCH